MNRAVVWESEAREALLQLARRDAEQARRIRRRVGQFAATDVGDVKKLQGSPDLYRLRAGDWRIIFAFRPPGSITVLTVTNRRDAYRD